MPLHLDGLHHITLNGADRATSLSFWRDVMGMPFVFEQPNLDDLSINHLYFDPGDGRLITIFTSEDRTPGDHKSGFDSGAVHHIAFTVSPIRFQDTLKRLRERDYAVAVRDRGFMNSLYFREPLGHVLEIAAYKFDPPEGQTHTDVLASAYQNRLARGAISIEDQDWQAALEEFDQIKS
jgi:glyoxalase family protein